MGTSLRQLLVASAFSGVVVLLPTSAFAQADAGTTSQSPPPEQHPPAQQVDQTRPQPQQQQTQQQQTQQQQQAQQQAQQQQAQQQQQQTQQQQGQPGIPVPINPPGGGEPTRQERVEEYEHLRSEVDERVNALLEVPPVPAAYAAGIADDAVVHPGSLREAAATATSFIGTDGNLRAGVAAEVAPVRLLRDRRAITGTETDHAARIADSIRLSIATSQVTNPAGAGPTGSAGGMTAAFGARVALVDDTDWRYNMDAIGRLRDALEACYPDVVTPGGTPGQWTAVQVDCDDLDEALESIYDTVANGGTRLELATSTSIFIEPSTGAAEWQTTDVWLAIEHRDGPSENSRMGLSGSGALRYRGWTPVPGDTSDQNHTLSLGGRLEVHAESIRWSLSVALDAVVPIVDGDQQDIRGVGRTGTTLAFDVESLLTVRAGLQLAYNEPADAVGAVFLLSLALAGQEDSIFDLVCNTEDCSR